MTKKRLKIIFITSLLFTMFFGIQSVVALRNNSLEASRLLQQVFEADKANEDVEGALNELREYVFAHMNTDLSRDSSIYPPIQLKYTYERLVTAEKKRVEKATADVYEKAQKYCERQNSTDFSGRNRVPCIQKYVNARTVEEKPIEEDLYKFNFTGPSWTPDRAGITMVLAGFFAITSGVSLLLGRLVKK